MLLELSLSREPNSALQEQIADQIRQFIRTGYLRPGNKLPSSRELALQCNVSRNTVSHAYDKLISEGYVETVKGIGTKVVDLVPDECQIIDGAGSAHRRLNGPAVRAPIVFAGE